MKPGPTLAAAFCRALVLGERNIVVSGGTNSGKTTMVRALCDEIPERERVVTIEDTTELNLRDADRHPDVVSLEARDANVEGVGGVPLDELARHALRLSPNRVTVTMAFRAGWRPEDRRQADRRARGTCHPASEHVRGDLLAWLWRRDEALPSSSAQS